MWREAPVVQEVGIVCEDDSIIYPSACEHVLIGVTHKS